MPRAVVHIHGTVIEAWCPRCPEEIQHCYAKCGLLLDKCQHFEQLKTVNWQPLVLCELDKEGTSDA